MATIKGKLKTQSGDTMYPETSADKVIGLGAQVIVLEDNGSTTAGTWLAKTSRISSLTEGQLFLYKVAVAGASTTKLNITGSAGTALGAKTIYRYGTTKLTTQYAVGSYILLYYNGSAFTAVNDYDANSYAYVRQYQAGPAGAGTGTKYPILTRYNLTDKNGSYDTAYSRFHTDVTLDTSNGTLDAPAITVNGNAVLTSHQSLSNYVTLNSAQTITAKKTITTSAGASGLDVQISGASTGTNLTSIRGGGILIIPSSTSDQVYFNSTGITKYFTHSGSSPDKYTYTYPKKTGTVALTSDAKDTLTWDGHIFNILDNSNVELSYYGHASYTPHTGRLHFNGIFMVRSSSSEGDNIFSFQISNLTSKIGWDIPYNFTKYSIVGANYWLGKATYGSSSINSGREDNGGIVGFYNGGTGVKHLCFARLYDLAGGGIGPWNMSYLYGIPIQVNFELFCD